MRKYIVFVGIGNVGKTSSIRKLWELLSGKKRPDDEGDFHDILANYRNYKIGFHSWGDNVYYLKEYKGGIPDLEKKSCEIIVGAAKSSGATQKFFCDKANKADIFWVGKVCKSTGEQSITLAASHAKILIDTLTNEKKQK